MTARLPEVEGRREASLRVSDVTAERLRAAFGAFIADHPDDVGERATATWRDFVAFLVRDDRVPADVANGVR